MFLEGPERMTWLNINKLGIILTREHYRQGVVTEIQTVTGNPIRSVHNKTRQLIKKGYHYLVPLLQKQLTVSAPNIPIIYGLLNVNEKDLPFQRIISGQQYPIVNLVKQPTKYWGSYRYR